MEMQSVICEVELTSYLIVFFFHQLDAQILYLIHLLYSSARFEHYYAHLQEVNCINTASGIVTIFR